MVSFISKSSARRFMAAALTLAAYSFFFSPMAMADLPKVEKGQPLPSDIFVELAKAVNPAVVNIYTTQQMRIDPRQQQFLQFLERFYGQRFESQPQNRSSLGTGFIIDKTGIIVTNNHVIDKADVIKVQLDENDDTQYPATVIGKDARTDIAIIKIDVKDRKLHTLKFGNSEDVEVGEWVAAFGNPFGHGHTMTKGIISAKGREIDELNRFPFLQTDASINPGNSGGPLVNLRGEVVGVNTAIDARAQGIGFAIPINDVKTILPLLKKDGFIKRGFIGVQLDQITPQMKQALNLKVDQGALILDVINDTPAEKAGVEPYDVVVKFGKKDIKHPGDLQLAVRDTTVGSTVDVVVDRRGTKKTLKLKVDTSPDAPDQAKKPVQTSPATGTPVTHGLGFNMENFSKKRAREFNIPPLRRKHPIVVYVEEGSLAAQIGIAPGDVVLNVNGSLTTSAEAVNKALKKGKFNILRVLKGENVVHIRVNIP